jgi:hypothetical protein
VREVWEEVRVPLEPEQLVPCAVISLPHLNQIYHGFIVRLPAPVTAEAAPPESIEVGWFTESEFSALDNWDPGTAIDFAIQFRFFRAPTARPTFASSELASLRALRRALIFGAGRYLPGKTRHLAGDTRGKPRRAPCASRYSHGTSNASSECPFHRKTEAPTSPWRPARSKYRAPLLSAAAGRGARSARHRTPSPAGCCR